MEQEAPMPVALPAGIALGAALLARCKEGVLDTDSKEKPLVGMTGFEPATPTPPVWCATRLRYIPKPVEAAL